MKLTRPQLEALRRAIGDEAWALAILKTLGQVDDPELRLADVAMARRLLDDALTTKETIGFIDPRARARFAHQRKQAASDVQATWQTFELLETDAADCVRKAVVKGRAAREVRFPDPEGAAQGRFKGSAKIPDPMSFVAG
jgi:hypothetical protein